MSMFTNRTSSPNDLLQDKSRSAHSDPADGQGRLPCALLSALALLALVGLLALGGCLLFSTAPPAPAPTAAFDPALHAGSTRIAGQDGMTLVYAPAGEFLMGNNQTPDDRTPFNETPQIKVYLEAYWIDQTEVTNAQFARFVQAKGFRTDAEVYGIGLLFNLTSGRLDPIKGADWRRPRGPGSSLDGLDAHPVVQVSNKDGAAYCAWAGRRLPSEAEWEKAARGTDGRLYPWGEAAPDGSRLNFADRSLAMKGADPSSDDGYEFTAPVGHYLAGASPYGALDMAGNVMEWVADPYDESFYQRYRPTHVPVMPSEYNSRGLRGGAWNSSAKFVRAAARFPGARDRQDDYTGFRCAVAP